MDSVFRASRLDAGLRLPRDLEGGTAAVMVRSLFGNAVPPLLVDLVLALVSSAPAWANLVSLVYARRAQGRPKIQFLRPLLLAMAVCVGALALLPVGGRDSSRSSRCTRRRGCCGQAWTRCARSSGA